MFNIYKFGIMVEALDMSQKCFYLVKQLNEIVDQDCQFSPIVFYNEYGKSVDVNRFGTLLEKQVWGYDGIVIATNLATAETLLQCPCPRQKYFYIWDLEWLYNQYAYQTLQNIYQGNLILIARNEDHAKVIEKCWKKPEYVMDNFDTTVLQTIVTDYYQNRQTSISEV